MKHFFQKRRNKILNYMKDNSIAVIFCGNPIHKSADENYKFHPNYNFYYLTGLEEEKFILVLTKLNYKTQEYLFIEKNDEQLARWIGEKMSPDETQKISGIEKIMYLENFNSYIDALLNSKYENIYFNIENYNHEDKKNPDITYANKINKRYPHLKIHNLFYEINDLRIVKDEYEIDMTKKAIEITKNGIYEMMKNSKPDMMEYQIEAYFDFILKSNGVTEYAFPTIAASGKNGAILHYSSNNSKASDGDLILFDLGAKWNNYSADISRTFPVNGRFTQRQKDIYNVILDTMKEIENNAKPGITLGNLNELSKRLLADGCKKLGLIEDEKDLSKYYFHSIGHFLGLDTHDVGQRGKEFEPGMIITNEPGLYIPEENIGIRIEDDLLITENGCENLSKEIIKEIEDIENFMK
ncbi:aminopeptidase P family protein [Oceanotoga teriensis]|uniref:aminopeptidase P family protein n=1 Tax=Oceanotoga teriensis TaxID=515440 RepID=UPI002713AA1A|nr:aminopeptidase P family protein [Oceanotoga teriensis]MDO7977820.1 aminopeptidase P family protein [Oceanotoga teriensis]